MRTVLQFEAPNNPATSQSHHSKQQHDQCIAQVKANAQNTRKNIGLVTGLTFGDTSAACLLAGPGAPECVAAVGTVTLINTGVIWAGEWYSESQEEAACPQ